MARQKKPALNRYCPHCGTRFKTDGWPRKCPKKRCGIISYRNAITVPVVIQPVIVETPEGPVTRILGIRRGIVPHIGGIALIGGYQEWESWQEAAIRELLEELRLKRPVEAVVHFQTHTVPDGSKNLLFCELPPIREADLPPFTPSQEVEERVLLDGSEELCFPSHTSAMRAWFVREISRGMIRAPQS